MVHCYRPRLVQVDFVLRPFKQGKKNCDKLANEVLHSSGNVYTAYTTKEITRPKTDGPYVVRGEADIAPRYKSKFIESLKKFKTSDGKVGVGSVTVYLQS